MTREVKLTQGMVAIVSECDFEMVNQFKWHASLESRGKKFYAVRWHYDKAFGRRKIRMHRFVLGLGTGFDDDRVVDHLNDDSLDNRRENLEIISQEENMNRVSNWRRKTADVSL